MSLLRESLESAREIGMRALEERAAARLNEFGRTPRSAGANDDLTAREAEVLRLIAIGRSNADIALALSISLNTVAHPRPQHSRQDRLRQPHRGRGLRDAPRSSAPLVLRPNQMMHPESPLRRKTLVHRRSRLAVPTTIELL